jgi:hypothetical protein
MPRTYPGAQPLSEQEERLARLLGEGVAMQVQTIRDWKLAMRALGLPKALIKTMLEDVREHLDKMIKECET